MTAPLYDRSIATHYDLATASVTYDIDFWKGFAAETVRSGGQALELGCGTLRILIPVAEAGVRVTGIDVSPDMLAVGREKLAACAPEVQARATLLEGDVRALRLDGRFDLIYMPFNTLPMVQAVADQVALFRSAAEHLAPGGRFALDLIVPDLERMAGQKNAWQLVVDTSDPATGRRYQRDAKYDIDLAAQRMRAVYRRRLYQGNALVEETLVDYDAALVFPRELEHLAARAGLEIEHLWGDFARSDFHAMRNPRFLVMVARAAR